MQFSELNVLGEKATPSGGENWSKKKITILADRYQTIRLPRAHSYEQEILVHRRGSNGVWVIYLEYSKIKTIVKTPDFKVEIERIDYIGGNL